MQKLYMTLLVHKQYKELFQLITQALTNRIHVFVTYSKSYILQIAVLVYFLGSTFMNTTFLFPEYVK